MSSAWVTSVLPAVATGVVTTALTFFATRAGDKRKFLNDRRLQSLAERRALYAEFYKNYQQWRYAVSMYYDDILYPTNGDQERERMYREEENARKQLLSESWSNLTALYSRFAVEVPREVRAAHRYVMEDLSESGYIAEEAGVRCVVPWAKEVAGRLSVFEAAVDNDLGN
ncbi:hypothetical protein AB0H37_43720 [Actinomadura sp. NPDC023710]|uniref:hypothetical protein n=1 Tax=Actinomadura sp. NPDC023710 TaxID=3158219 RepID=UPI0033CDA003